MDRQLPQIKPFAIVGILIDPPVILAPMADVTNGAFRRVCKEIGKPGLVCTEQISTQAIHYKSARTYQMFDWTDANSSAMSPVRAGVPFWGSWSNQ